MPAVGSVDKEQQQPKQEQKWNTKNLGLRLAADAVSAASAAILITPIISIIDRSIMENASGRQPLLTSLRTSLTSLLRSPQTLLLSRPFALIFLLYGGTYATANALDTATSTAQHLPASHVTSGPTKFAASSTANIGLCIYKDQVFARLFGPAGGGVARAVALPTYALFAARDCLTIFASFNVPPLLGPVLARRLGEEGQRWVEGQTLAQFAAPAAVQLVSTPVHLLGLDIYNRPGTAGGGWRGRWEAVRRNWGVSTAARVCRIVPAFGVGGVVNFKMRRALMERLE
ncbi:hypothetical protein QBC39DRAFT_252594 [Podospora conica]|nr:hypothetical protein QBC39DRAFT_252594 [Schizothecium conicum]